MGARLTGKTIVITGASSGIGAALAQGMAREGANIVVGGRNEDRGRAVVDAITGSGGNAVFVRVDVTDRASVINCIDRAVAEYGRLDAYFNNAGMNSPMRFLDITEENFEMTMRTNALGSLFGIQEAAKQFILQGSPGKVINTLSAAARTGFPSFAPYSASKAALLSLTQAAARALAPRGITVNGFTPGVVDTPLWTKLDKDLKDLGEEGFDSRVAAVLLGRASEPEDIVPTAVFLAAPDSDYMTGQVIAIEGGLLLV